MKKGWWWFWGDNSAQIQGDTEYTLTIDPSFQAASGDTLAEGDKVSFTTLNQSQATTVNMIMMGVMMVGMIFFTSAAWKNSRKKKKPPKERRRQSTRIKKRSGLENSWRNSWKNDKKNKEKQAAAAAKRASKNSARKPLKRKRIRTLRQIRNE